MRATTLTLRNDFHNSEAIIRVRPDGRGRLIATYRQWTDALRKLCGMSDCQCGNIRGPITDSEGRKYEIDWHSDRSDRIERIVPEFLAV